MKSKVTQVQTQSVDLKEFFFFFFFAICYEAKLMFAVWESFDTDSIFYQCINKALTRGYNPLH